MTSMEPSENIDYPLMLCENVLLNICRDVPANNIESFRSFPIGVSQFPFLTWKHMNYYVGSYSVRIQGGHLLQSWGLKS